MLPVYSAYYSLCVRNKLAKEKKQVRMRTYNRLKDKSKQDLLVTFTDKWAYVLTYAKQNLSVFQGGWVVGRLIMELH